MIFLIFLLQLTFAAKDLHTHCDCGSGHASGSRPLKTTAPPTKRVDLSKLLLAAMGSQHRIVGGYEPERRPFMAFIEGYKDVPERGGPVPKADFHCGGALLNQAGVIIAIFWKPN